MASKPQQQLREKRGMVQYSDLSKIVPPTDVEMQGGEDDSIPSARQPEEEPARYRLDSSLIPPAAEYDPAIETPVPDSPFSNSEEVPE